MATPPAPPGDPAPLVPDPPSNLSLTVSGLGDRIQAAATSRTLAGVVVRFGVPGNTSRGLLKVAPGALTFPDDLGRVKLTREHERDHSRGHLTELDVNADRIRAAFRVADGPEGDAALREAADRTRDGLSFDVINASVVGDSIVSGRVVAVGQVGIPAYADGRVDTIAAAADPTTTPNGGQTVLTDEQRTRLEELRTATTLTDEETAELNALTVLDGAAPPAPVDPAAADPGPVAASLPAVPRGAAPPAATSSARTRPRGAALEEFYRDVTAGLTQMAAQDRATGAATITAALSDITHTSTKGIIEPPAWSGELWSGVVYEPVFLDLFTSGDLTAMDGKGWRFTDKLAIADYAGDKAAIPSDTIGVEANTYTASRMAVGVDIDRKYFDFPNDGFVQSLFEQVRESWQIKLDAKVQAYILANVVPATTTEASGGTALPAFGSILKAAAGAVRSLKRRRVGKASFVLVNDDDLFDLFDVSANDVSAFLDLFNVDPANFRSAPGITAGTVIAGAKQAATVRTLPGSPIRVEAQSLTNAGVDQAFFGYWAIEEHHTSGLASCTFT